jgi:5-methylcytosine-specific restriction endonuclease McrA
MVRIEAVLRPEEAALVWAAIETGAKRSEAQPFDRADGLLALARGGADHGAPVELVVSVPAEVLTGASEEPCAVSEGSWIPAESARRIACEAPVIDSAGKRSRSIPVALRRALDQRDRTCRFPGCTNHVFVEAHHVVAWARGGETTLANLVLLCTHHHRVVHEGGFRVELDAEQRPRFHAPDGSVVEECPPVPSRLELGFIPELDEYVDSYEESFEAA